MPSTMTLICKGLRRSKNKKIVCICGFFNVNYCFSLTDTGLFKLFLTICQNRVYIIFVQGHLSMILIDWHCFIMYCGCDLAFFFVIQFQCKRRYLQIYKICVGQRFVRDVFAISFRLLYVWLTHYRSLEKTLDHSLV